MSISGEAACPVTDRIAVLIEKARLLRKDIIQMCYEVHEERRAHPGPSLSAADIVAALFFDVMRIDPKNPQWPDRDRFILSKGHASPALYAALVNKGYFDRTQLKSFRRVNGMLQGHPDMKRTPGVDMTTGSLGHGLAAGMGMALAGRLDKKEYHVFVLLGDGECQEGLIWETALSAPKYRLDNLIAIIDRNGFQSCDRVCETIPLDPFPEKWSSFGWNVLEIDGHDMAEITQALELAEKCQGKPSVIIANTVKGKGVSFMEQDNAWHQKAISTEQYRQALLEIGCGMENG